VSLPRLNSAPEAPVVLPPIEALDGQPPEVLADRAAAHVDTLSYDAPNASAAPRAARVDAGRACSRTRYDDSHRESVGVRCGGDPGADAEAPWLHAGDDGRGRG